MTVGFTYVDVDIENCFVRRRTRVRALVDTGCVCLTLTDRLARELGFDLTEVATRTVTLADGTRRVVPQVGPIRLHFAGRYCDVSAFVFGDEPVLGVVPMEMMDLVVNPVSKSLTVNPASPDVPTAYAKGFRIEAEWANPTPPRY